MAQTSLSRYETGAANPSEPSLRLLAVIYDKPYEWFFIEEEDPQGSTVDQTAEAPDSVSRATPDPSAVSITLEDIARNFSVRFDRLESHVRAQAPGQGIAASRVDYDPNNYDPSDRSPVQLMEVASAAGSGTEVYDETPVGLLWFRNDWLQSHIISVRGASMVPTLPDGCSILVDRKRKEPQEGRIFVMRTEEGLVVKRLGKGEVDQWITVSDNPDWEPAPLTYGSEIIGEVRWSAVTH